MHIQLTI